MCNKVNKVSERAMTEGNPLLSKRSWFFSGTAFPPPPHTTPVEVPMR